MNPEPTDSSSPAAPQAAPWLVFAESTRGSAHEGMGLPNQDSYRSADITLGDGVGDGVVVGDGDGDGVVVAVADGHGNWRHFRSASGSRFAVDAACECVGVAARRLGSAERSPRSKLSRRTRSSLPSSSNGARWSQATWPLCRSPTPKKSTTGRRRHP